jgi:hypothetical protein
VHRRNGSIGIVVVHNVGILNVVVSRIENVGFRPAS